MVKRTRKAVKAVKKVKAPIAPPQSIKPSEPSPADVFGTQVWHTLQGKGYVYHPDREVAVFDEGGPLETIVSSK